MSNQEVCIFWVSRNCSRKGVRWAEKWRFAHECMKVGLGGAAVCSCGAVAGAQEEEVKVKMEETPWKYSAVIHKVESTTKLHATV